MKRFHGPAFVATLAMLAIFPAAAQHTGHTTGGHQLKQGETSPYEGLQSRRIKALSEQQIAELETGRGMGLALAAELNGYPGPLHVLELADKLGLTKEQTARTEEILAGMKAETIPIGKRIIEEEMALDRLFAEKNIDAPALVDAARRIGLAQGELRAAHLRYHLETAPLLDIGQIERYAKLRGYAAH